MIHSGDLFAMERPTHNSSGSTRREFLKQVAVVTTVAMGPSMTSAQTQPASDTSPAWYRRAARWGQTNITEKDPVRYDID